MSFVSSAATKERIFNLERYLLAGRGTGTVFYVDSGSSEAVDNTTHGFDWDTPFATIDYAIGRCTANRGDLIVVAPGHAETISAAAGIALDIAGVTIKGLGRGSLKPTLTFSATASTLKVTAANCKISNLRFVSAINNLATFLDVDEGNFEVEDCTFVTSSTYEAYCFIDLATTYDDFVISGCEFHQPTDPEGTDAAAGTGAIYCVDSENIVIEDCIFNGKFETAIVHNKTTACKNLFIRNCYINKTTLSTAEILTLVAGATGAMKDCCVINVDASDATEAQLVGTIGTAFWLGLNCSFGNDSAAGGQLMVVGSTACS